MMRSLLLFLFLVVSTNSYGQRQDRAPQEFRERVHQMERELAELVEHGKHDQAERMRHEIERMVEASERRKHRLGDDHDERDNDRRRPPQQRDPRERIEHLHIAAEHLHQAGLHEMAEDVQRRADDLERQIDQDRRPNHDRHPPEQVIQRLAEQLENLRREFKALARRVDDLGEK